MRFWRERLILPAWLAEQEELSRVSSDGTLWPTCHKCSEKYGYDVAVMSNKIINEGHEKNVGDWTEIEAKCHGERDIIRIDGIRWSKTCPKNGSPQEVLSDVNVLRMAALKMIRFFDDRPGATRTLSHKVLRDLQAAVAMAGNSGT